MIFLLFFWRTPVFFSFVSPIGRFLVRNQQGTWFSDGKIHRSVAQLQIAAENHHLEVCTQNTLGPEQALGLEEGSDHLYRKPLRDLMGCFNQLRSAQKILRASCNVSFSATSWSWVGDRVMGMLPGDASYRLRHSERGFGVPRGAQPLRPYKSNLGESTACRSSGSLARALDV